MARKRNQSSWKMIRVSVKTHGVFAKLHARREEARERGQVRSARETVTQDEVLQFLLEHFQATEKRRRRSRTRYANGARNLSDIEKPSRELDGRTSEP